MSPFDENPKRDWAALLLAFTAFEGFTHWSILSGTLALYQRDLMLVYFPLIQAILREVSLGAFPLRDPTSGFGQPLLADPSCQILYPPSWIHILMPPPLAYAWFVSIHSVFGALGIGLLAKRFSSGSVLAGLVGGGSWLLCGPLISLATLWHHMAGAAWIPWVWLAVERVLARTPGKPHLVLGAVMGAQMLAGSAEMCAGTLLIAALRIILARDLSLWRAWIASGIVAVTMSAGVWLPAAELLMNSARSALPATARTYWSLHPVSLFEFFLPIPFSAFPLTPSWLTALFEGREPFLASMYFGAPVLPLCLAALADSSIRRDVRAAGFLGALGAVLTALGKNAMFYSWIVALVPILRIFRYPTKAMIPAAVLFCVAAGVGIVSIARSARARRAAGIGILILSLASLAVLGWLQPLEKEFIDPSETTAILDIQNNLPGDLLGTVILLIVLGGYLSIRSPRFGVVLLTLIVAGQLRQTHSLHHSLNPTIPTGALSYRPEFLDLMRPPSGGRIYVYDYSNIKSRANNYLPKEPGRWKRLDGLDRGTAQLLTARDYLSPLVGAFWSVEYAWDVDMRMLFDRRLADMTIGVRRVEETAGFLRLLQISGVERMVSLHDEGLGGLRVIARKDFFPRPLQILEVPDSLPRAFLVSGRQRGSGDDLKDLVDPAFDPRISALIERDPVRAPAAGFHGSATILERRSDRIEIETVSDGPALLTLIEGAMPGWRAWIDGRPAAVERANALFIGTEVPAGNHRVEFRFLPVTAVVGAALTLLTGILLLGSFLLSRPQASQV